MNNNDLNYRTPLNTLTKKINVLQPESSFISITNSSDTTAKFSIKLNDQFYSSIQEIKDEVYSMSGQNKDSLYYYAWKFVCNTNYFNTSLSAENWTTTLLLFVNSIGYGLCDKQAIVMYKLWKELGYQTRLWSLNGHEVPEVYYSDSWHMLDPAYRIYYLNDSFEIASVQQLMDNPDLIIHPKTIVKNDNLYKPGNSKELAELYSSKEDNQIVDHKLPNEEIDEFIFELPQFSSLEFPGIFMSDPLTMKNTPIPNFANCRIKIPPFWEGTIKNVLVLADIKGNGVVKIDSVQYNIGEINLKNKITGQSSFIKNIYVGKHSDTVEIVYYLNPLFSSLKNNNTLQIKGQNIHSLNIHIKQLQKEQIINERLKKQYFFYDNSRVDLFKKLISDTISALKNDTIHNAEELIASFSNYCKLIRLGKEETEKSIKKLTSSLISPAEINLVKLYETITYLPQKMLYYDIIQISEKQLYQYIHSPNRKKV